MASKAPVTRVVADLVRPVAEQMGLELWDVTFAKEGSDWCLTLLIDKAGGVNLNDCENFSRAVDPLLDEADPIEPSYYLQVFSPGLERKLTCAAHYAAWQGKPVQAKTIRPKDGKREFFGHLGAYDAESVTLCDGDTAITLAIKELSYLKADDFNDEI